MMNHQMNMLMIVAMILFKTLTLFMYVLTQQNMIASSNDSAINNSAINRHSCISRRKHAPVRFVPSAPVNKKAVKKQQKIIAIEPVVDDEPKQQIVEETVPRCIEKIPESKPIEEKIEQGPIKVVSMEDAVHTAVNNAPVERKVKVEQQQNITKILDNRTTYTGRHYAYNSILGTHICYH